VKLTRVKTMWTLVLTQKNGKRVMVSDGGGVIRLFRSRAAAVGCVLLPSAIRPVKVRVTVEEI